MKKKINEIKIRMDLYPRLEVNNRKVQEYSENIENLPPIIINQDNILIDGLHRIKARKQARLTEIEVEIEKTKSEDEIRLKAIELNAKHGLQLSYKDKRSLAVKLYDGKNAERLINNLSISGRTFRNWTSNKRKQMEEERNERILSLYLNCWTQQMIANDVKLSEGEISKTIKNFQTANIPDGNFKPYLYNIWNLGKDDSESRQFGKFPQIFMENLIYYWTNPFDIVYDPFAGGGVVIDTCKKWFRRYYISDLNPIPAREEEIRKWDIAKGLPKDLPNNIKLIFLDPPYWKQAEGKYSKDKEDLANMHLNQFYDTLINFIKQVKKKLAEDGKIALIISATQWKNNLVREDHVIELIERIKKLGFKIEERIICPYSTEQYNGKQVEIAKKKKICLNTYRDLVIMKKE